MAACAVSCRSTITPGYTVIDLNRTFALLRPDHAPCPALPPRRYYLGELRCDDDDDAAPAFRNLGAVGGQEGLPHRLYGEAALYKQLSYYHRWVQQLKGSAGSVEKLSVGMVQWCLTAGKQHVTLCGLRGACMVPLVPCCATACAQ